MQNPNNTNLKKRENAFGFELCNAWRWRIDFKGVTNLWPPWTRDVYTGHLKRVIGSPTRPAKKPTKSARGTDLCNLTHSLCFSSYSFAREQSETVRIACLVRCKALSNRTKTTVGDSTAAVRLCLVVFEWTRHGRPNSGHVSHALFVVPLPPHQRWRLLSGGHNTVLLYNTIIIIRSTRTGP